jgi:uncharacterized repeat protein (TIGR02543 family)
MIKKYIFILAALLIAIQSYAVIVGSVSDVTVEPTIIIHDTVVAPGELLLQIDALHFTGDNGNISAITLKIEVDTNLIEFINIQNMTLVGSWLANYNYQQNEISIIFTAFSGSSYDIDGKLLDLHLNYFGGFPASLHFKDGCEVSNINLQSIDVIYEDGLISQITPEGAVTQDSLLVNWGESFAMPVVAEGAGYDSVNQIFFRVGYDTLQLQFQSITESLLTGVSVLDEDGVLTIAWEDNSGYKDFTSPDTMFYMNFNFIGDTNTITDLLPGSKVFNNGILMASGFEAGKVTVQFLVDIIRDPDTGGVTTGSGYYFEGDVVTVVATPDNGFYFKNWVENGVVVSSDSLYSFIKQPVNDTLTANFEPEVFSLSLIADPPEGGDVLGAGNYVYGEDVTVTAVPSEGYEFICWLNGSDTVSYNPVYTFVMPPGDITLTAKFQIMTFSITVVPNNSDYGTATGGGIYTYGDTATVIATPFENYKFVVWTETGQPVSYDSLYSFFVNSDRDLFANFQYIAVCSAPVGLYVDSLSDSTAMLHWIPSGEESEWDLIWGEYGFDTLNSGTLVEGLTENRYLLTDLDPGTVYDFYVRAVCTGEEHSVWAGPYTFTTWYVGINEESVFDKLVVYPNPADDVLVIDFGKTVSNQRIKCRIISLSGMVELEQEYAGKGVYDVNVAKLSRGTYVLQISEKEKTVSKVFIKK